MSVKILMVCLGNICRSPLAEGLLAAKLPRQDFFVDSAGTGNWHVGNKPDDRSIAVAKKNGVDISCQQGRQFKVSDFENFDYIYVMDTSNYSDVVALAKSDAQKTKVKLILVGSFSTLKTGSAPLEPLLNRTDLKQQRQLLPENALQCYDFS